MCPKASSHHLTLVPCCLVLFSAADNEHGHRNGDPDEDEPIAGPSSGVLATASAAAATTSSSNSRSARMGRRLLNEVSSSQNSNSSGRLFQAHEVDHNYLQPDRMRNTRRTLSRHQRNADELDPLQGLPNDTPAASVAVAVGAGPGPSSVASTSRLRSSSSSSTVVVTTIVQPQSQQPLETNIMQRRNYLSRATTSSSSTELVHHEQVSLAVNVNGSAARQRSSQSRSAEPVRII